MFSHKGILMNSQWFRVSDCNVSWTLTSLQSVDHILEYCIGISAVVVWLTAFIISHQKSLVSFEPDRRKPNRWIHYLSYFWVLSWHLSRHSVIRYLIPSNALKTTLRNVGDKIVSTNDDQTSSNATSDSVPTCLYWLYRFMAPKRDISQNK